ncbi:hypothetical protein OG785_32380 [Streptomyces sp. NBC_00006]|uniref:hypothetical protein n=1 Tax=Streptomyces sp. NBC_00006 TaxID=2975619 RepID=UPI00224C9A1A|nr:hypothetical protein [Streptomyces sp. NBC_00006]MCX5535233.1 hypothetical protein [Streptomyces sp. NBC_00006]
MSWQMGLEYLRVLVWPTVVVTLAVLLRAQLRGMVSRVTSVETPVATVAFDTAADQAIEVVREEEAPTALVEEQVEPEWPNFAAVRAVTTKRGLAGLQAAYNYGSAFIQGIRGILSDLDGTETQIAELDTRRQGMAAELRRITNEEHSSRTYDSVTRYLYVDMVESACHDALICLRSARRAQFPSDGVPELEPSATAEV